NIFLAVRAFCRGNIFIALKKEDYMTTSRLMSWCHKGRFSKKYCIKFEYHNIIVQLALIAPKELIVHVMLVSFCIQIHKLKLLLFHTLSVTKPNHSTEIILQSM
ncbi:hypothetical protein ACJX0J_040566, partial [Zea mays]